MKLQHYGLYVCLDERRNDVAICAYDAATKKFKNLTDIDKGDFPATHYWEKPLREDDFIMLTLAEYNSDGQQTGRYTRLPDLTRDTLLDYLLLFGVTAELNDGRVIIPNCDGFLFAYQCDLFRDRPGEVEISDLLAPPNSVN